MIKKRVILVFWNLLKISKAGTKQYIVPVLDIFGQATDNFEDICYSTGEDSEFFRSAVLFVDSQLKGQIKSATNLPNKDIYFNKIYTVTN